MAKSKLYAEAEIEAKDAIKELSDEDLSDEWRELFIRFRRGGKLPDPDRTRFHFLSKELAARGVLT
jgi:hypothetical protein